MNIPLLISIFDYPTSLIPLFSKMNILVVEDHTLLRTASEKLLKEMFPEARVEGFSSPSKAMPFIQNRDVEFMIVDLEYNNQEDGISFVKEVKQKKSNIKCIAYTSHKINQVLKDIREAGFNSYLNKDASEKEMLETVDAVLDQPDDVFYESSSYLKFKKAIEEQESKYYSTDYEKLKSLTKTEKKALQLISEENTSSNDLLANKLGIRLNTMKKHLSNIYRKLNVKSKDGLKHFWNRTMND
ncbi:response regulator [Marinifilum sp. N1E240]|nr:response regulator [Marinifilum sp. N1E240]